MRKENAFVLLLIGLCLALAAMAAFSSSPDTVETKGSERISSLSEAVATGHRENGVSAFFEGSMPASDRQQIA